MNWMLNFLTWIDNKIGMLRGKERKDNNITNNAMGDASVEWSVMQH